MSGNIITLGRTAVITDIHESIDWVMSCFFFSKHSQSRLFRGKISSITKLIQQYGNDPTELKTNVDRVLNAFLGNFFEQVDLSVSVNEDEDTGNLNLIIDANVTNSTSTGGTMTSVGYSLTYYDSILRKVLETTSGRTLYVE